MGLHGDATPLRGRWLTGTGGYRGLVLVEVLIALALFSVVVAAIYSVLMAQHRFYALQTQIAGTRNATRIAVAVLAAELRPSSPRNGDLYAITADSVALRSTTGVGVICEVDGPQIELSRVTGVFGDSRTDSALVLVEDRPDGSAGWLAARIQSARSGGTSSCPDGRSPDVQLELDREAAGASVGAPLRAFRPYIYKLYRASDGRWWLGQRLRSGRMQPITGPFVSPGETGLRFVPRDRAGLPAGAADSVVEVMISVKAQSARRVHRRGKLDFFTDTLSTRVYLRNS